MSRTKGMTKQQIIDLIKDYTNRNEKEIEVFKRVQKDDGIGLDHLIQNRIGRSDAYCAILLEIDK